VLFQKFWALFYVDIVHAHLHRAEQIILHRRNVDGLVHHEHDDFTGLGNHMPGHLMRDQGL
jgi:hypothetical protein